jgi:hypothetical protein
MVAGNKLSGFGWAAKWRRSQWTESSCIWVWRYRQTPCWRLRLVLTSTRRWLEPAVDSRNSPAAVAAAGGGADLAASRWRLLGEEICQSTYVAGNQCVYYSVCSVLELNKELLSWNSIYIHIVSISIPTGRGAESWTPVFKPAATAIMGP